MPPKNTASQSRKKGQLSHAKGGALAETFFKIAMNTFLKDNVFHDMGKLREDKEAKFPNAREGREIIYRHYTFNFTIEDLVSSDNIVDVDDILTLLESMRVDGGRFGLNKLMENRTWYGTKKKPEIQERKDFDEQKAQYLEQSNKEKNDNREATKAKAMAMLSNLLSTGRTLYSKKGFVKTSLMGDFKDLLDGGGNTNFFTINLTANDDNSDSDNSRPVVDMKLNSNDIQFVTLEPNNRYYFKYKLVRALFGESTFQLIPIISVHRKQTVLEKPTYDSSCDKIIRCLESNKGVQQRIADIITEVIAKQNRSDGGSSAKTPAPKKKPAAPKKKPAAPKKKPAAAKSTTPKPKPTPKTKK